VQVFDQANRGPAAARNAGAERAAGTYLAFTDDDCAPDPLWLVEFDRALQAEAGALLGGRTVNALPDNRYSTTSQVLVDFVMGYLEMGDHLRFFTSNNIAMPRECFAELGGFDPAFPIAAGEDRDFCDRWLAEDWPMLRVPDAVVGHAHRLSLGRFLRQHFNYGRGGRVFRQVLGARGRPVIVDPGFYTASVWNAFREGGSVLQGGVHAALTVVAHAAYAGGMGYEFVRGGRSRKRVASPRTRRFIA
jgi:GT2 family glycosyltransferase